MPIYKKGKLSSAGFLERAEKIFQTPPEQLSLLCPFYPPQPLSWGPEDITKTLIRGRVSKTSSSCVARPFGIWARTNPGGLCNSFFVRFERNVPFRNNGWLFNWMRFAWEKSAVWCKRQLKWNCDDDCRSALAASGGFVCWEGRVLLFGRFRSD